MFHSQPIPTDPPSADVTIVEAPIHVTADTYRRVDAYKGERYRIWSAGPDDRTPAQVAYEHDCSWCYLGYAHTQAEHTKTVDLARDRQRSWIAERTA